MNIDSIAVLQVLTWSNKAVVTAIITVLAAIFQFPARVACIHFSVPVKYQINKCTGIIINKTLVLTIVPVLTK